MSDVTPANDADDDSAFAEGTITLWGNLLTMIGLQLLENGTGRDEVLAKLTIPHESNEETVRSPRAKASASRDLMSVYHALAET